MTTTTAKTYARETAIACTIIAFVMVVATLYFGRVVFLPLALALTLSTLLQPVIALLGKIHLPPAAAAPIAVVGGLLLLCGALVLIEPTLEGFAAGLPGAVEQARSRVSTLPSPLNRIANAIPRTGGSGAPADHRPTPTDSASLASKPAATPASAEQKNAGKPADQKTSTPNVGPVVGRVFGTVTELTSAFLQTMLLLIFFLAAGDSWRRKLTAGRGHPLAHELVGIASEVQSHVARYLAMTALINVGQGIAVALAAWGLGLPSPIMWGIATFVAEFLPYVGGFAMVALLFLVGLAGSGGIGHALLGPAAYLVITTLQNNVVSPLVYGRGLELNPAAILVSVILWWFIWGVAGAFLAVPILAIIKVICDRTGGVLDPLGRVLAN